jgi:hypothetical protein
MAWIIISLSLAIDNTEDYLLLDQQSDVSLYFGLAVLFSGYLRLDCTTVQTVNKFSPFEIIGCTVV